MLDPKIQRRRFGESVHDFDRVKIKNTYLVDAKGMVWEVWERLQAQPIISIANLDRPEEILTITHHPHFKTIIHTVKPSHSIRPFELYFLTSEDKKNSFKLKTTKNRY